MDSCPKAEPWEHRSLTLYTLASRLQKQKAKLNPLVATCDFIGYFISQCYVTFIFQFFKFYLCFGIPFLSLIVRTPACLFFFWPSFLLHYSPLWCSDLPRVKEHHLDLEVCIFNFWWWKFLRARHLFLCFVYMCPRKHVVFKKVKITIFKY
jgi:hypothetical protein